MNEVYNKIASDFMMTQFELKDVPSGIKFIPFAKPRKRKALKKVEYTIQIQKKEWSINDQMFWLTRYGLTATQLEYCNVFPIAFYFVNGIAYKAENLAYAFIEHKDGKQTFKIYQPHSKEKKWINNNNFSTWELWTQMPKFGETLIITSSRKDAMVIKTLFKSSIITSCSLQSEGVMPKMSVMNELKARFKYVYILYDNDYNNPNNPGRTAGARIAKEFDITQIEIDSIYQQKDPSDFRQSQGEEATRELILNLINDKE